MSIPTVVITGGPIQDPAGNILPFGKVTFKLSQDASVSGYFISHNNVVTANLTNSAIIIQPFTLFPNPILTPANTYYTMKIYNQAGQLLWDSPVVIPNAPTSINNLVPQF